MKPTVYIETTVPSYLTAWDSRDPIRLADQQITREWWASKDEFELFTSELVLEECREGDVQAAADRLLVLAGLKRLGQQKDAERLANALLTGVPLPNKAALDALHIAIATVHGIRYLLTWNCNHIANLTLRPAIERVCRAENFEAHKICTPRQLLEDIQNARD
ncbi:hypothetical protein BH10PLA2_BH10PLA2_04130 [soil metagenome]